MSEERYTVGRMFRSYLNTAAMLGLRAQISQSSPELKQLFEKPPLVTARIPGSLCDQLYDLVFKARGREAIRSIGHEAMTGDGRALIGSLLDNTVRLYGRSPQALFSNLSMIMMPVVGNIEISWTPQGERAGVVGLRPKGPVTQHAYTVWEGYLQYFLETSGASGTVEAASIAPDRRSATIAIHW